MKLKLVLIGAALTVAATPQSGRAHSGGLNAEGCHHDRKRGGYHCHRASVPSRPSSTSRSLQALSGGGRSYPNCSAARAAGAAPVRVGDPGYGRHLDRDEDGIGCE